MNFKKKSISPLVSTRWPWELNHWTLGNGSPVTLQSISVQLPSRAIIWLTLVNTAGTDPPSVALPVSVWFPSALSCEAPAVCEATKNTRTRKTNPPAQFIFSSWRFVTQGGRNCHSSRDSILQTGYLVMLEGNLVFSSGPWSISLKQESEGHAIIRDSPGTN